MKKQKLLVTVFAGLLFLAGAGIATAQSRGGGGMGGGGMHGGMGGGGMQGGGAWQGGGGWHGGGGNWNGGGGWHGGGGNWNGGGGWHGGGGNWNGWHGGGWYGANVWFGFPGTWWWPAYYPYAAYPYYGYAGYPYYGGYYGGGYYGGTVGDSGDVVYIQRDTVPAAPSAPVMRNSGPGEYLYYCIDPPGYYPQVPQCTRPWLKVVPDGAPRPNPIPQYPQ